MIDISIIIPVYNASSLLTRCIDSIFNQHTDYTYEVICVDDGSTDDSVELINARKEKNIRLFKQQNSGPAVARNKGLELAQGDYVTFIDADDYWRDGYIQKTVDFMVRNPECVAVSVTCKNIASFQKQASYNPSWMDESKSGMPFVLKDFLDYWAEYCHVGTCSTTMRTAVAKQTKGMRTDLRITEDYEFWIYFSTFGKWGLIPEVLYVSDGGDVTQTQGWLNKMEKRWRNAPSISEWEKRIIAVKSELHENEGYKRARGRISRNLTYCQLLSDRLSLSREEAHKYGDYFTNDTIGRLMNIAKHCQFTWWILARFLKYREYHRK
ncbi:MAG: glycosyltransferase family 2 protein [Prevotella sp.]|nr:glycosyltransferase family 2 protein [Prevotella sp.]